MARFKRGTYRVKTMPVSMRETYKLSSYPNFHVSGSVYGMKNLYYGLDAKLVRCGSHIYNVSSSPDLYDIAY